MQIHLVRRKPEVPHRQIEIRERPVDHGFQPCMMLLTIRETAADDGDVIAFAQLQRVGRKTKGGKKQGGENGAFHGCVRRGLMRTTDSGPRRN